jgi:3-(3-hydroxy-phenyl)propionate hydroxylase
LFGQPALSNEHLLDDAVGYAPVLILRHRLPSNIASNFPVFDADEHPKVASALDAIGANAALIRPDRYIAASAVTDIDIAALAGIALPSPMLRHEERELAL